MNLLFLCTKGAERIACQEIKELIEVEAQPKVGAVSLSCDEKQLLTLLTFSQSAKRILILDEPENLLKKEETFCVRSKKREEEKKFGEEIHNKGFSVDLTNPDKTFYVHDGEAGLDITGDISKRSFRVFTHRQTMKGPAAFSLLKMAGYTGKELLVDPFAKDGTIILEAVHHARKRSVRFFDRGFLFEKMYDISLAKDEAKEHNELYAVSADFRDLAATKKNAKIAGVEKDLTYSRQDIEWLDVKFKEKEIDLIVTYPPKLSEKPWKEFVDQVTFVAKRTVVLVSPDFKEGKKLGSVWLGKDEKWVVEL